MQKLKAAGGTELAGEGRCLPFPKDYFNLRMRNGQPPFGRSLTLGFGAL